MSAGGIRANPEARLPARVRRRTGLGQDIRRAWVLTFRLLAARPVLFAAGLATWGLARYFCVRGLVEAHLGLAGGLSALDAGERAGLVADGFVLAAGPLVLGAVLLPPAHRQMLHAARSLGWRMIGASAARMLAALMALALAFALTVLFCVGLPLALIAVLGPVSTLLTVILLLPLLIIVTLAIPRMMVGLPAISLGLKRALAEGWLIGRDHRLRTTALFLLAGLPLTVAYGAALILLDPLSWPAIMVQPVIETSAIALTASITGLLYRAWRLPAGFRPDLRPSRHPAQRQDPVFTT